LHFFPAGFGKGLLPLTKLWRTPCSLLCGACTPSWTARVHTELTRLHSMLQICIPCVWRASRIPNLVISISY